MKLLILGPPGTGKGTYASRLSSKLGIPHVSTGDLLREFVKEQENPDKLVKEIKDYMQKGALVPDELVLKVLKQELGEDFILDGFPRNKEQAYALNEITEIDTVINLKVPEPILINRLSSRRQCSNAKCNKIYNLKMLKPKKEGICDICGSNLYQRKDDEPETIKQRLNIYNEKTAPVLECFSTNKIMTIENKQEDIPPEIVVDKILKELEVRNSS